MSYYNSIAKGYNELHEEEQLKKLSIIKNNIKTGNNTKILDVGCGTGISSRFECSVVGVDPSVNLIKQGSNRKKVIGIAEFLPFKDKSFNYVVSITAMHNFINIKKSIGEMKRVCRRNFVFSVLKKSERFGNIKKNIEKNFRIEKSIEEDKDVIFFCRA
ncbi:methyltransferase domain-containing protein [Candidatus Woesearchaeota archaeon]|nr:methyltransferase domain-containing protein [Candidatus Woesearchaeota archaeon]